MDNVYSPELCRMVWQARPDLSKTCSDAWFGDAKARKAVLNAYGELRREQKEGKKK